MMQDTERRIVIAGPDRQAPGGISTVLQTLLDSGLARHWPVHWLSTWQTGSWPQRAGCAWQAAVQLQQLLARREVQALHLHAAGRGSFWRKAMLAALVRAHRLPVILHVHDGTFIAWWLAQPALVRNRIRLELQQAQALVVLDEDWARLYAAMAPGARITVLPNPVILPPAAPRFEERPASSDRATHEPATQRVLFMGRLRPDKGLDELMQAVSALRGRLPGLILECAGDGDQTALVRRARELQIEDRLQLPGWLSGPAKWAALQRAQVLALPSWAEGQPMAALEAMAMGKPVLATAVGGLPSMLRQGGGVLVPPRDVKALTLALGALMQDGHRCRALGLVAREGVARRHEASRVLGQWSALYASLGLQPCSSAVGA